MWASCKPYVIEFEAQKRNRCNEYTTLYDFNLHDKVTPEIYYSLGHGLGMLLEASFITRSYEIVVGMITFNSFFV